MKKTFRNTAAFLMCLMLTVLLFGFTVSAEEFVWGDYSYVLLESGAVKITAYNGEEKAVTIPETIDEKDVTVIGASAFEQKTDLERLVIPGGINELEAGAISFCPKLESITIYEGTLQTIDGNDIKNCESLKTVNLPSTVVSIGTFEQCPALDNIVVAAENHYLKNVDGIIYSADMKTLIKFPQGKNVSEFRIPSSVEKIADNAFYEVVNPVKVYIPLTLKEIEGFPFAYSNVSLFYEGSSVPAEWKEAVDGFSFTVNAYKLGVTEKITSAPGENSTKLSWTSVYGADGYYVFVKNGSAWKSLANVKTTSYTVNGTNYGSTYSFAVRAYKISGGKTVWADSFKTYTTVAKVPAPAKVTSTQTENTIKLSWSAVKGVDGYLLFLKTSKGWQSLGNSYTTSATFKNLKPGVSYTFAVRAGKKLPGKVLWSDTFTTHLTATRPAKPAKVTATQDTNWIKLTWTASAGATGYRVFYKSGNGWAVGKDYVTGTSFTFTNLKSGAKNTFAIRPYIKGSGGLIWGDYITYMTSVKPAIPAFAVTTPSIGQINVKWNAVPGATEYWVYYKKNTGNYQLLKKYSSPQTLTFKDFAGGDTYTFAVRAGVSTSGGIVLSNYTPKSVTLAYRTPRYLNMIKNGVFSMKFTSDGLTETYSLKGDKALIELKDEEDSNVALLYNNGWWYINHTYRAKARISASSSADMVKPSEMKADLSTITIPAKFITGKATFGGKTCHTEAYSESGITTIYYYNGITLVGIETRAVTGERSVITVHNLTNNVPDAKFYVPSYEEYAPI